MDVGNQPATVLYTPSFSSNLFGLFEHEIHKPQQTYLRGVYLISTHVKINKSVKDFDGLLKWVSDNELKLNNIFCSQVVSSNFPDFESLRLAQFTKSSDHLSLSLSLVRLSVYAYKA